MAMIKEPHLPSLLMCMHAVPVEGVDPNSPIANIMSHLLKQLAISDSSSHYALSVDGT